jgi:hypothetical protein
MDVIVRSTLISQHGSENGDLPSSSIYALHSLIDHYRDNDLSPKLYTPSFPDSSTRPEFLRDRSFNPGNHEPRLGMDSRLREMSDRSSGAGFGLRGEDKPYVVTSASDDLRDHPRRYPKVVIPF